MEPNLILISLDAVRADHLSLYGYPLSTSPSLERIARTGVVFDSARTVVPLTGPAHASLFTSTYPHLHGAYRNGIPLGAGWTTLAERLCSHGYDTAAFVSGWTLHPEISGLDRGFRVYDHAFPHRYKLINRERFAAETNAAVLSFLETRRPGLRPIFLFVHYFDAHDPYRRHKQNWRALNGEAASKGLTTPAKALSYDSEVTFVDKHLGSLIASLEATGILTDRDILCVLADHGESLGEHGYWGHGRRVYEQTLRIPLVLRSPALVPGGRRIAEPVSILDIMPTLWSLLGLPVTEDTAIHGRDLAGLLVHDSALKPGRTYFETFGGTLKGLTRLVAPEHPSKPSRLGYAEGALKVILDPASGSLEVYDLATDPGETRNLGAGSRAAVICSELSSWFARGERGRPVRPALSRQHIEQLRNLGYLD